MLWLPVVSDSSQPHGVKCLYPLSTNSSGKSTRVAIPFQRILSTQRAYSDLLNCRQTLIWASREALPWKPWWTGRPTIRALPATLFSYLDQMPLRRTKEKFLPEEFFLNHTAGPFISAEGVISQLPPQPSIPVSVTLYKPYNLTLSFLMERKMTPDRITRALSNPVFLVT